MIEDENDKFILESIANLRKEIAMKADKSAVEQISSFQDEIDALKLTSANRLDTIEQKPGNPKYICQQCIDNNDMETAFLTVLKYIENISSTKAESRMVDNKASKRYVESLFGHLNVITGQQITEANANLRETLEAKLNSLSERFDSFSKNISKRIDSIETEVVSIEDFVVKARQATQSKIEREKRKRYENGDESEENLPKKKKTTGKTPLLKSRRLKAAMKSANDMNFVVSNFSLTPKLY